MNVTPFPAPRIEREGIDLSRQAAPGASLVNVEFLERERANRAWQQQCAVNGREMGWWVPPRGAA